MNNDGKWNQKHQGPAVGGTVSASIHPAFSVASVNRTAVNDIPPHHAYPHPHYMPIHTLGYPNRQGEYEHFTGKALNLTPQLDGYGAYGAYPLETEGTCNGGTGADTSVGYVGWATSTTTGEYSAQHGYPGHTHAAKSPYDPQTFGYVEQGRIGGTFKLCHGRSLCLTIWS